jgi:menaquinone-dependent protoporphyrinogen oxidase
MASILVIFESKYGQTSKIAEYVGQVLRTHGHVVRVLHVADAHDIDLTPFDGVFVLAPVYLSKHPRSIVAFVRAQRSALRERTTAFVSVSNSAASRVPQVRDAAMRLASATPTKLGWSASLVAIAGGALAYPRYGFLLRLFMRWLARSKGEPTDLRRVHELTSWVLVDRTVTTFLELLESSLGVPALVSQSSSESPAGRTRTSRRARASTGGSAYERGPSSRP